eukprot:jgi/Tetstr1/454821/TSEL_041701.t1
MSAPSGSGMTTAAGCAPAPRSSSSDSDGGRPLLEFASRLAAQKRFAARGDDSALKRLRDGVDDGGDKLMMSAEGQKKKKDNPHPAPARGDYDSCAPVSAGQPATAKRRKPREGTLEDCCIAFGCGRRMDYCRDRNPRQKVCHEHQQAERVALSATAAEGWQRYCQRCARFHPLDAFDAAKRSCRSSLEMHNLRRRRNRAATSAKPHARLASSPTSPSPPQGDAASPAAAPPVEQRPPYPVAAPPPQLRCQVDNCDEPLNVGDRANTRRYRVCSTHQQVLEAAVAGEAQRFCQQCGRFHPLENFDGTKHSCRAGLASHNSRRRRLRRSQGPDMTTAAAAPASDEGAAMAPATMPPLEPTDDFATERPASGAYRLPGPRDLRLSTMSGESSPFGLPDAWPLSPAAAHFAAQPFEWQRGRLSHSSFSEDAPLRTTARGTQHSPSRPPYRGQGSSSRGREAP